MTGAKTARGKPIDGYRIEALKCFRRADSEIEKATVLTRFAMFMSDAYLKGQETIESQGVKIEREDFLPLGFYKLQQAREAKSRADKLERQGKKYMKSYQSKMRQVA